MNQKEAEHVIGKTIFALLALAGALVLSVWLYKNNPDIKEFDRAMIRSEQIHRQWMDRVGR